MKLNLLENFASITVADDSPFREKSGCSDYLPRLEASAYLSDAVILWTFTLFDRKEGWLTSEFHQSFRELMLHAMVRQNLCCPAYVLMPDHLHFVWMGLQMNSDQRKAIAFLRTYLEPKLAGRHFQSQAHDHVLRGDERMKNAFARICNYIFLNPVRAGLAEKQEAWEFSGALVPGYPKLVPFEEGYWEVFWRIYQRLKSPDCRAHVLGNKAIS